MLLRNKLRNSAFQMWANIEKIENHKKTFTKVFGLQKYLRYKIKLCKSNNFFNYHRFFSAQREN